MYELVLIGVAVVGSMNNHAARYPANVLWRRLIQIAAQPVGMFETLVISAETDVNVVPAGNEVAEYTSGAEFEVEGMEKSHWMTGW